MRYLLWFLILWSASLLVVWGFAVAFGNSTDFASLLGSAFALAVGGVVGLAINDRRTRPAR